MSLIDKIDALRVQLCDIVGQYSPATFASSFGVEDMVLLDNIACEFPAISVFTLDTGRLPKQTLDLMTKAEQRYSGIEIVRYYPLAEEVNTYVSTHGENAFYESVDLRKSCCGIRKVEPLARALVGKKAWLTGLRREQAVSRTDMAASEFDATHGLQKFNPLIDWTNDDVWAYIREHSVPYNALHDKGYPSIGCDPCTRAVKPGEDPRAGRWWWEQDAGQKECGLHVATETSTASPVTFHHATSASVAVK